VAILTCMDGPSELKPFWGRERKKITISLLLISSRKKGRTKGRKSPRENEWEWSVSVRRGEREDTVRRGARERKKRGASVRTEKKRVGLSRVLAVTQGLNQKRRCRAEKGGRRALSCGKKKKIPWEEDLPL